jgi:hypothetical protein
MFKRLALLSNFFLMTGCEHQEKNATIDDLNSIKKSFLLAVLESGVEESPFHMNYTLRTVFFSPDIVSLFGEIDVYDHLPHGWWCYEGKTFCRVHGKLKEIKLGDLFLTMNQKEFLRKYCEDLLKADSVSYFSGKTPLCTRFEYEDVRSFVIDDKFFIIIFQPYRVGGLGDGPIYVKIPYEHLRGHWNDAHPLPQLLHKTLSSKSYTASWDHEDHSSAMSNPHDNLGN